MAALDAMRKAHQNEVLREVARFKQEFLKQFQKGGQSPLTYKEKEYVYGVSSLYFENLCKVSLQTRAGRGPTGDFVPIGKVLNEVCGNGFPRRETENCIAAAKVFAAAHSAARC